MNPVILSYLKKFYSVEEIEDFWKQAGDALLSKQTLNLHLNSRGRDGSSSTAVVLSNSQEQAIFMATCEQAIADLQGTSAHDQGGTHADFSRGAVIV